MSEPRNIKINVMVTQSIWDYLHKVDNYSNLIRELIERDIEIKKKRGKNNKLSV